MILAVSVSMRAQDDAEKSAVNATLDLWHKAAAEARFKPYFALMSDDAVFIGTDPTEYWTVDAFKAYAKPYFDKGKAWNFTPLERHVYLSPDRNFAWFDELLDTQMKICRGSGVLRKVNGQWRIAHYVLSMAVPNGKVDEVVRLKSSFDDALTAKKKKP
jgi:ketosteroid isomerase-like protein